VNYIKLLKPAPKKKVYIGLRMKRNGTFLQNKEMERKTGNVLVPPYVHFLYLTEIYVSPKQGNLHINMNENLHFTKK
jgi:hypothetical protein